MEIRMPQKYCKKLEEYEFEDLKVRRTWLITWQPSDRTVKAVIRISELEVIAKLVAGMWGRKKSVKKLEWKDKKKEKKILKWNDKK